MKLLHIIVNSKPEEESSSRKVARKLVEKYLSIYPECQLEEVNLYDDYIPRLKFNHFNGRNNIITEEEYDKLSYEDKKDVDRINELCESFKEADIYVIAAPLWSMSFPSPLKEYLDCVVQNGKTVLINEDKVEGLLKDKKRRMIYVQSSGGKIPFLLRGKMSQGVEYVEDLVKFMGIEKFKELLVNGTGFTRESRLDAEEKAILKIDEIIDDLED